MTRAVRRIVILVSVAVLLAVAGVFAARAFFGPRYHVGQVAEEDGLSAPLEPPAQTEPGAWRVAPDISLAYEAHGWGRPVLIVHGGPGIPPFRPWAGLRGLEQEFKFHYYHQRGCGRSTRPFDRFEGGGFYGNLVELERTLGVGAQVADIERIRRILGEDRLVLVGHSFGGFLASMYAAEFPDRVERLVLVAPAGLLSTPDEERDLFRLTRDRLPAAEHDAYDALLAEYMDFRGHFSRSEQELAQLNLDIGAYIMRAMNGQTTPHGPAPSGLVSMVGGWSVFAAYFSLGKAWDFRSALDRITAPTLIVCGADDEMSRAGALTYTGIARSELVTISSEADGAPSGHGVFDQCPDGFELTVGAFLRSGR